MRDTTKLIADLRYWQEHSTSKGKLFKAAADEIEACKKTFCPECHMPMGSNEKKCSECDVSWALEGEGKR